MTERLEQLKAAAASLTFADRDELRDYLACYSEGPKREFSVGAEAIIDRLLDLDYEEQLGIADLLRRIHACPPGVLSANDPNFSDIINERVRQIESGEVRSIPADEVFRNLDRKYAEGVTMAHRMALWNRRPAVDPDRPCVLRSD